MRKFNILRAFAFLCILFSGSNTYAGGYCVPSYTGTWRNYTSATTYTLYTNQATSFWTYIASVDFGDLQKTIAAPPVNPDTNYLNFDTISTSVVRGGSYPLSIGLGNGANTQTVAVWIDYNQNGVFESTELLGAQTDVANTGSHQVNATVQIPINAALGKTRMRIGTLGGYNLPDPCINNGTNTNFSQQFQDYTINILAQDVQQFESATCLRPNTSEVTPSSADNLILEVQVINNEAGILSPNMAADFDFSTLGTTNPADVTGAKLFYTGKNPNFADTLQVGGTVSSPSTYFTINANQKLQPGTNYFWLAYDISSTANLGNLADARCNSIFVVSKRVPVVTNPAGTRAVGYCPAFGDKNNFIFVYNVSFDSINNYSYIATGGYGDFTNEHTTLYKRAKYPLSIQVGNGANQSYTKVWIDYNHNGIFDTDEVVMFDSLLAPGVSSFTFGPVSDTVTVPKNAVNGPTRMRVISSYYAGGPPSACEAPVEIGEVQDYTVTIADTGQAVANFIWQPVCQGDSMKFTDKSYLFQNPAKTYKIASWKWYFGDGDSSAKQNPYHLYKNPGVYTVSLTVNSNLPGTPNTVKYAVTVNKPVAGFVYYDSLYKNPVRFADETTGGQPNYWSWNFGDPASGGKNTGTGASITHTFDTAGTYNVKLIVGCPGGCFDTIVQKITIVNTIPPIANFTSASYNPYYKTPIKISDQSPDSPATWQWVFSPNTVTFDSGTSATSKNPVISFNAIGTYKVTLKVTNKAGSDTISKFFVTKNYTAPIADFYAVPTLVKAGQLVSFVDASQNSPTQWTWLFGNNDSANVQYPIYQYPNTGSYDIELDVANLAGKSSKTKNNYVTVIDKYHLCDEDAGYSPLYTGEIASSGDTTGYYQPNSTCGFLISPGPGCSGPITLKFNYFNYTPGDYLRVYDGFDSTGKPLFTGNGFTGNTIPPNLVSDSSGAMYIQEHTTDTITNTGFQAHWYAAPNIKPSPNFTTDTLWYINSPLVFTNTTLLGLGNKYKWDYLGNGSTGATTTNGKYTYADTGIYNVSLTATNCKGTDSIVKTITIIKATSVPVSNFTSNTDTAYIGQDVYFYDKSKGGATIWRWNVNLTNAYYDQGTGFASQNPVVVFTHTGLYTVSLTASNYLGTGSTVTKTNYIYVRDVRDMCSSPFSSTITEGRLYDDGGPSGNYSAGRNCHFLINPCGNGVVLRFNSFSFAAGDYLMVFDGTDGSGRPLYSGAGLSGNALPAPLTALSGAMYIEEVTAANSPGAAGFSADWSTLPFTKPAASFTAPDTGYSGGSPTLFTNTTTGIANSWKWYFTNNTIAEDSSFSPSYQFQSTGTYTVMLVATECSARDTFRKQITIVAPYRKPQAGFRASTLRAATNDVVQFTDLSAYGPTSWVWHIYPSTCTYTGGTDSFSENPEVVFNNAGYYTVKLIAVNSFGSTTITKTDYIDVFQYCKPAVKKPLNPDLAISRVSLLAIDNANSIDSAYLDFTKGTAAVLTQQGQYQVTVERATNSKPVSRKIWIDYNQDGVFNDTNEVVAYLQSDTSLAWAATFTVPISAVYGYTRMRIGTSVAGSTNGPCGTNTNGQFQDYRIIISTDKTPPVITILGASPANSEIGYAYKDAGATAYDIVQGNITPLITTQSTVDTGNVGQYSVTYYVTDSAGNTDSATRTVNITSDKTPPVLTVLGKNPDTVEVHTPFADPAATAHDNRDGNVTGLISEQSNVDTSKVTFLTPDEIFYTAYDKSGNASAQQIRKVWVVDTIAPVITLLGADTVKILQFAQFTDPGVIITDNYDKNLAANIVGTVDSAVVGTYPVGYFAVDRSGNTSKTVYRVVIVQAKQGIGPVAAALMSVTIYPVPAKGYFVLAMNMPEKQEVDIQLINDIGQVVAEKTAMPFGNVQYMFSAENLNAGIYFVKIAGESGTVVRKVEVVK